MLAQADQRSLSRRLWNKWRRFTIDRYGRRKFRLDAGVPYVSFTFDDFPQSAFSVGGRILIEQGVRGTYFVSLQLLGSTGVSGRLASHQDLKALLSEGHELGCHTFEHLDGTRSSAEAFERSIQANRAAFAERVPDGRFPVFAYPLDGPTLAVKRAVGQHFAACRGSGQTINAGTIDLNLLKAYFLDRRNNANLPAIRRVIEENVSACGWLIFATHDVSPTPSAYGCPPEHFAEVVRLALRSGARVLPMNRICQELAFPA